MAYATQYITPTSSQHPCEVGQGHEPHFTGGEPVKTEQLSHGHPESLLLSREWSAGFQRGQPWGCFFVKHPALPTAPLLHHGHFCCKQMAASSRWYQLSPHRHKSDHEIRSGGRGRRTCGKTNLICNQMPVLNAYHVPSNKISAYQKKKKYFKKMWLFIPTIPEP